MPIYEYSCHRCGQKFEVRQKFSDEPLKFHDECGGEAERLISVPALQFKGKGWYVTDYGRGGILPAGSHSNGASESKNDSHAETKSETKTESKAESKAEPAPAKS